MIYIYIYMYIYKQQTTTKVRSHKSETRTQFRDEEVITRQYKLPKKNIYSSLENTHLLNL